ncbi:MAG: hypothetical protein JNK15_25610 [Planctomycetes bacterium]|nr:hypothetical protein [Planctomycetota bacterium]
MSSAVRSLPPALLALLLAVAMNLTNLFEPLTVDDVCHQYYAAQVAREPLAPFEFEIDWHQKPVAAWDVMVAPVTSYWWAPAIALFGDSPVAWKAWFLPAQWLFCFALLALVRRLLRPGPAFLLVAAIALGPAVLPGLNLMLEVPVLSLGFASLAVFLRAGDRRSLVAAVGAGLLFGLAFQTKYSAMGFFAPWVCVGVLRRNWRELAIGLSTAVAVALGIECLLSWSHGGGSYFLRQLELTQLRDWRHLGKGLLAQVGVLGLPAALLLLHGLGCAKVWGRALLAVHVLAWGVIAWVPDVDSLGISDLALDSIAYLATTATTWGVLAVAFGRLGWTALVRLRHRRCGRSFAVRAFLCAWFVAEIAASLVVSPFPAARRVLLVVLAATVVGGWFAVRRRGGAALLGRVAALSVGLGLSFQGIDYLEGRACVVATQQAADYAAQRDPRATVWFTGGWGFEYYAPRAGMRPLARGRSEVKQGDWIMIGSLDGAEEPWFHWNGRIELQQEIGVGDAVPWSLLFGYYSGSRPLDGQRGPRFVVWVYRALEDFHAADLQSRVNPWRDH